MAKELTFQQIVDSRLSTTTNDTELKQELEEIHKQLMETLSAHSCLKVSYTPMRKFGSTTPNENDVQYRIAYYIRKEGRKITWKNVYEMVNKIKVTHFEFK